MKKTAVVAVLAVLMLAGCSAAETPAAQESAALGATPSPSETYTPLANDDSVATATPEDADATFIEEVRVRLNGMASTSDADLISAGHEACRQMGTMVITEDDELTPADRTILLEGQTGANYESEANENGRILAVWGALVYCTEFARE